MGASAVSARRGGVETPGGLFMILGMKKRDPMATTATTIRRVFLLFMSGQNIVRPRRKSLRPHCPALRSWAILARKPHGPENRREGKNTRLEHLPPRRLRQLRALSRVQQAARLPPLARRGGVPLHQE